MKKLLSLLCLLPLMGCPSTPNGESVNWDVISIETGMIEQDLLDLADVAEANEPETAETLREIAGYVAVVKRGVDAYIAGGGPQGEEVFAAIDAALELADQLLKDDSDRIYVAAARMLARRIKAYLPQADE